MEDFISLLPCDFYDVYINRWRDECLSAWFPPISSASRWHNYWGGLRTNFHRPGGIVTAIVKRGWNSLSAVEKRPKKIKFRLSWWWGSGVWRRRRGKLGTVPKIYQINEWIKARVKDMWDVIIIHNTGLAQVITGLLPLIWGETSPERPYAG